MAFSVNDKVKTLVENPEAKAVLEKHNPELMAADSLNLAYGMTFKALAEFPSVGMSAEAIAAIDAELQEIETDDDDED